MEKENGVSAAKQSFNNALMNRAYQDILKNDEHLNKIIKSINIKAGARILDLGTGNGYVAFQLARMFPDSNVIGLDIADKAIEKANEAKEEQKISNLSFITYNGTVFPFENGYLTNIVSRYTIHHFPDINHAFGEISRTLCAGGEFVVSDPIPNDDDKCRVIDTYMRVKKDGHVCFYKKTELESFAIKNGLIPDKFFFTQMSFPFPPKEEYVKITSRLNKNILESYQIRIEESIVHATINVLNMRFKKK